MIIEEFEDRILIGKIEYHAASDELEIIDIEVRENHRRRGIASRLFAEMIKAHPSAKSVYLDVRTGNRAALAFYQKLGFKQSGVRKKYYSDGEDAITMLKSL